jgi:hypothetical protein
MQGFYDGLMHYVYLQNANFISQESSLRDKKLLIL